MINGPKLSCSDLYQFPNDIKVNYFRRHRHRHLSNYQLVASENKCTKIFA